ncbi:uncharacterized protein LOC143352208 [Halictus rubicundus]|uniref:uncharacterized protein LOC143352208 n=1 Tax=Halictus rubicundus TaxID=77578 RepID=UPI0040371660
MNSVWLTSPFVKFNTDNLIYNETLCTETHFLNKFARDKYNERQGNFAVVSNCSSKSNLLSQEGAQDENIEENFTVTANGASCLKIDSKIASKKTKSRSTLSERSLHSHKVASSSNATDEASNKIHEADNIGTELSSSKRTKSINYSSKKTKGQLSANDTTENNTKNDLLNSPFELVQIYPGNKENISDLERTFSDVSREESSLTNLPKENKKSSRVPEDDAPPLSTLKCGQGDEACEHHCLIETASNEQCRNESKAVEDIEEKNETFKLSIVRDTDFTASSDDSEKSCLSPRGKKRLSSARSRKVLKRTEELMNYLDHDTKKMDCDFAIANDSEYDETIPFVCKSERTLMEDLIGMKEDREDNVISSSLEADMCSADVFDKYPNESNENNVAKSRCDPFTVANSSNTDLFQRNSTGISVNERKLGSHMESINLKQFETREEGKNILNKIETMRVNAKQNGGNRTSERKITEYAIDDANNGIIENSEQFDLDYGNIKICNLLSKIHEQLYTNFQKMESIWILLQDTSPIDSVRSAMPLRLLVRIISRCKSYIHDSHDSYKAESKIAKSLLSLVIDLAKAVDQNKLVLEKQGISCLRGEHFRKGKDYFKWRQKLPLPKKYNIFAISCICQCLFNINIFIERQLDSLLVKLYQEKNLYKKRLMMNEVISGWDHGLREISDIMQDISDKLRTVITESEEKENVRNPRQLKYRMLRESDNFRMLATLSINLFTCSVVNKIFVWYSFRRKDGVVESKGPKGNLTKKESNVETQMSVTLNKHNAIKQPKGKTAMKFANTQRHQDVEKISYNESLKIVDRKMNYDTNLSRYNVTSHPKSKPSTKSLNIQRCQDVEKPSCNEPLKIVERKMNDSISLSRYNATRRPKSKASTKSLNIQRCQEKLSVFEPLKIVERKINDNVRHSEKGKLLKKPTQSVNFEQSRQPMSRQKYRVANNPQPVWRPGGVVKLPSSSSATTLTQRNRPLLAQANERSIQLTDNAKEGKHGRSGESKKKISTDPYLTKCRIPNLTTDCSKQSSRKHITNPESISKLKPKSRALKVCFKEQNVSSCRSEKVLKLLEEIIKSPPADKKDKRNTNKSVIGDRQNETDPIDPERSMDPIPIEEEIEIPQDEPTRDIDPNEVRESRSKHAEVFEKTQQLIEELPECPLTVISPTDFSPSSIIKDQPMDSKSSVHLENLHSRNNSNFTCTECTTELKPSSISTAEFSTNSSSQKRQKDELSTSNDSLTVKAERHKDSSSVNVCSNSHTMSLTVLKEFLRDQGVDVGLLNRAEQCVKDKRKCRGCAKTKSASLADVMMSNKQRDKCSKDSADSSCCRGDMLRKIVQSSERNSADLEDAAKSLDHNCKGDLKLSAPEKKDTSTCTETNNNDTSVQTSLREMRTKSVQIIIEEDTPLAMKQETETMETQTEMISTKHTATDCKSNSIDASSMTESNSVKDSTTETVSYASKLTERSDPKEEISDHCDKNATKFVEIWNEMVSKEMRVNDDQDLTEKHRHLGISNEDSSDKAPVCEEYGGGRELGFRESDSSTSSCCSHIPECCKHLNCWIDPEMNNFYNFISSETIATLESAAIRARDMYRAMYIYQQHMESKLKEEEEKKKFEKIKNCEQSKNLSTIDSFDVIVKDSYHSCKYNLEILSRAEIASLSDESEYEISESVSMPITTVSQNETDVSGEDGLEICKKSSSHAVLGVVKSLMELLIQKMDDIKITEIDSVQTVSSRTCSKIHIEFSKKETERKNEFSISPFSRQNLLMLIYGVVCSIVFWCLRFTITCDVVL